MRSIIQALKRAIKAALPKAWLEKRRTAQRLAMRKAYEGKNAKEIFSDIYANARWGGEKGQFYSGDGSVPAQVDGYAQAVGRLINQEGVESLVDIGCGDFTLGSGLAPMVASYTGIDVVPALIERNNREFGSDRVRFLCLDASADPLPDADACTIRQVLQHLGNAQISAILEKTRQYRLVIISEHYPAVLNAPKLDKPQGMDTRVSDGSAVVVTEPPFSLANAELIYEAPECLDEPENGETIKTLVIRNGPQP